jgi:hypothetical protein
MTDGLPNCDLNFSNWNASNGCDCVDPGGAYCAQPAGPTSLNCNDYVNAAASIQTAANNGVKTIVLGYGDLNPGAANSASAFNSLNAMANAGGFTRQCYDDAGWCSDADAGTCSLCAEQFWRAGTASQLASALSAIGSQIRSPPVCQVTLNPVPADPTVVSVDVIITDSSGNVTKSSYPYNSTTPDGQTAWNINGNVLQFDGYLCGLVLNTNNSVRYLVRALTNLNGP